MKIKYFNEYNESTEIFNNISDRDWIVWDFKNNKPVDDKDTIDEIKDDIISNLKEDQKLVRVFDLPVEFQRKINNVFN